MRSTLTREQLRLAGPYYRQHPELAGQFFTGPYDTLPKDEVSVVVQKLPDWPSSQYGSDGGSRFRMVTLTVSRGV